MANNINYTGGTSGQIVTTDGNTINGAVANIKQVGGIQLLSTQSASSSSQIDFTSLITGSYTHYRVIILSMITTSIGQPRLLFSTDNGSSYDTTSGHYAQMSRAYSVSGTTVTVTNSGSATNGYIGIGSAISLSIPITIIDIYRPSTPTVICHINVGVGSGTGPNRSTAVYTTASDVDAFRIYPSTGVINSGTFNLYGVV